MLPESSRAISLISEIMLQDAQTLPTNSSRPLSPKICDIRSLLEAINSLADFASSTFFKLMIVPSLRYSLFRSGN